MRLTCPNCGARYEVDDAMIPAEGRDVQCSECSTTWFQPGRRPKVSPQPEPLPAEEAATAEDGAEGAPRFSQRNEPQPDRSPAQDSEPEAQPVADTEREGGPVPEEAEVSSVPIPETEETPTRIVPENGEADHAEADASEEEQAEEATSARRDLDPSVRDILREEAEREARLRRAEAEPVETQDEMPLEEQPDDVHRSRRRSELDEPEDAARAEEPADQPGGSRRDLLPDIDEINSTLRSSGAGAAEAADQDEAGPAPASKRRSGVRIGFFLTLAVAAGLIWIYANADLVSDTVPQAAPVVDGFTARVDVARLWLDELARDLAESGPAE